MKSHICSLISATIYLLIKKKKWVEQPQPYCKGLTPQHIDRLWNCSINKPFLGLKDILIIYMLLICMFFINFLPTVSSSGFFEKKIIFCLWSKLARAFFPNNLFSHSVVNYLQSMKKWRLQIGASSGTPQVGWQPPALCCIHSPPLICLEALGKSSRCSLISILYMGMDLHF